MDSFKKLDSGMIMALAAVLLLVVVSSAGAEVTCDNENNAVAATTPTADFTVNTVNEDGIVTHDPTGLIWMSCALGQQWDDTNSVCTGGAEPFNWHEALVAVQNLNQEGGYAGHSDWRLPNKNELEALVERRCWSPAINAARFPDTPAAKFWTSTPSGFISELAWYVDFDTGVIDYQSKNNNYKVRLVRGGL